MVNLSKTQLTLFKKIAYDNLTEIPTGTENYKTYDELYLMNLVDDNVNRPQNISSIYLRGLGLELKNRMDTPVKPKRKINWNIVSIIVMIVIALIIWIFFPTFN